MSMQLASAVEFMQAGHNCNKRMTYRKEDKRKKVKNREREKD